MGTAPQWIAEEYPDEENDEFQRAPFFEKNEEDEKKDDAQDE